MDYSSGRKTFFIYLGLSLLSFLLIVSSNSRVVVFFKDIGNTVVYPFRFVFHAAEKSLSSITQEKESQEVQLEKLNAELEDYKQKLANLNALKDDNDHLRELLGLKKSLEYDAIVAEVIGRDFTYGYSYITINKGRIDGISVNLPVVTFSGTDKVVIGIVSEASLITSKIRTVRSDLSSVGVYLPRTGIQSVADGLGGTTKDIQLLYIDKSEPIEKGDLVYTSTDSQLFPPNLLVGKIDSIDNTDKTSTTYKVYLSSEASLDKVREVFVLRPKKTS